MSQPKSADGTPTASTMHNDDDDDASSFKSWKQQAATMNRTLDDATRAALATPAAKQTSNGRAERESFPDPATNPHEFRQYLDTQQQMQFAWQKQATEQQEKMQQMMRDDTQRQLAAQMDLHVGRQLLRRMAEHDSPLRHVIQPAGI